MITAKSELIHIILCAMLIKFGALGTPIINMPYEMFLAELNKAGLSVRGFASLIGMNRNSVSNYARAGQVPRHLALIATLLAEMNVRGIAFDSIIQRIDTTPKKPRGGSKIGRFGGNKQNQLEWDS